MRRFRLSRRTNGGGRKWEWPDLRTWLRLALAVFTWGTVCTILLGYNLFPGRVWLHVGEISPVEVRAPRTAQYVDASETEALRNQAAQQVTRQYLRLPYALQDAKGRAAAVVQALDDVRRGKEPAGPAKAELQGLPADSLAWVSQASARDLTRLRLAAEDILNGVMGREIRENTPDVKAASDQAVALAGQQGLDPSAAALLAIIVRRTVGPTHLEDAKATAAARLEAWQHVEDVVRTVQANDRIIRKGERVTAAHLAILGAVGLSGPRIGLGRAVAFALIAWLVIVLLGAQTRHWTRRVYESPRLLLLLALLLVMSLLAANMLALALPQFWNLVLPPTALLPNVWMLIVPAAALIAAVLLTERVGLLLALVLSALAGITGNGGLPTTILALGSSLAALTYLSHIWPPSRLRWIVGAMALTNMVLLVSMVVMQAHPLAMTSQQLALQMGIAAFLSCLYSVLATALALGGIFLLQRPFGITTHLLLLELSNPQHPLLKRMQSEAPGTYFASVTVASLADAAAEAIGADALLARVGALYHDLGKLSRPSFFVENQALLGLDNVHDNLSSSLSGLIIMSHVKDGVELATHEGLPREVADIIAQHHGQTLVSYFYHRALTGERPESVSEEHFRYPGPLPQTKEAALVMLADSVQAAVKSIAEPTPQRVAQVVGDVVRERVVDGQLAQCDLTFRDVAAVEAIMSRILTALLCHGRIEYPEPLTTGTGA